MRGLVQAEAARLKNLPPRKRQQLRDQGRNTIALRMNFTEINFQSRTAGGSLFLAHFRPPLNGSDHVVEIVGDPARELAERLEFLRVPQLLFQSPAVPHVP